MSPFRQVAGDKAGPAALGILSPPGKRTVLILRPRALEWDLVLLLNPDGIAFRELTRDQATAGARAVFRALENWAAGGPGTVEPVPRGEGDFLLRVTVADFPFVVCPRLPGQPYQVLACADADTARHIGCVLAAALCPAPGVEREVYFNTAHFLR